ncbi:tRNA (cytidine(32)/uridine(32)-2'-O)-methyltransferase [hydrothermal vent metagenome]|uniref:tRNA (Cytidine(32)/uridine(32)-2'-O)-methyltransferase n=1 Tax=hydrothermal vent metagenome TaxID=652676 RepID=A0A3B0W8Z3_9ZZZZ
MTQQTNLSLLKNIRIVLVNTSHPGNIGAAARAMKNMGLSRLMLVQPKDYPSLEAVNRSVGAVDILDNATVVENLSDAVSGCVWVAGTSARLRTIEWPILEPRECVDTSLEYLEQGDIAIVFGRENSGLTNDEMAKCNVLLHVPTDPDFSSLNLAAAVQVVCYEYRLAVLENKVAKKKGNKHRYDALANAEQMDGMYNHLHEALHHTHFFGTNNSDVVMHRLKGLFNRANVTQRELSIVRGICSAMQGKKRPR